MKRVLTQGNIAGKVDGKNRFTFRTVEAAGFNGSEIFRTVRAGECFGKYIRDEFRRFTTKRMDGIFQAVLKVKNPGKIEQLEHLIHFLLDVQQYEIAVPGFDRLEEYRKRTNTG